MPHPALGSQIPRRLRHVRITAGLPEGDTGQRLSGTRRLPTYAAQFAAIREALAADDTTVPCNNDLLAANFVEDGDRVWLIDYEYSGNNDPCFELGNIWRECRLSLDQLDELVTSYYGRA